jgi:hypothetical protein
VVLGLPRHRPGQPRHPAVHGLVICRPVPAARPGLAPVAGGSARTHDRALRPQQQPLKEFALPDYFFFIVAINKRITTGLAQVSLAGTITITPGPTVTRYKLFHDVVAALTERNGGVASDYMPVSFFLEPNDLAATSPAQMPAAL